MERYAIVCKQDNISHDIEKKLRAQLDLVMTYDSHHPQMVISVGGDGTMLYSVHKYIDLLDEVVFIGIHTGTLGFLTDYQKEEYLDFISDVRQGKYQIYKRALLEVQMKNQCLYALNEVRVENNRRSQVLDISINEDFFETFRGNGICISTASGSTAYNKSIGGAVIYSSEDLMQLSEIAGIHHNAYRSLGSPLILDRNHCVHIASRDFKGTILGIDHQVIDLNEEEEIQVRLSQKYVQCIQYKQVSFIQRLRRAYLDS